MALFAFGVMLFALGITVWLIGLAIRIAIRLFQLVLLLIIAGVALHQWLQQRRTVVLEGEVLPPEPRALPQSPKGAQCCRKLS
jgi:hypothetical protein